MKRGDIILIDFPYSDRKGSKLRPALVVQSDLLNRSRHDTVLAAISRTQRFAATEVLIDVSSSDGQQSGLRHTSVVDCANLGTFDQSLVHHTLGSLPNRLIQQVDDCLKEVLGLS